MYIHLTLHITVLLQVYQDISPARRILLQFFFSTYGISFIGYQCIIKHYIHGYIYLFIMWRHFERIFSPSLSYGNLLVVNKYMLFPLASAREYTSQPLRIGRCARGVGKGKLIKRTRKSKSWILDACNTYVEPQKIVFSCDQIVLQIDYKDVLKL